MKYNCVRVTIFKVQTNYNSIIISGLPLENQKSCFTKLNATIEFLPFDPLWCAITKNNCLVECLYRLRSYMLICLELSGKGWWWWRIAFVLWLTDERHFVLFPAETIVRDPHHRESPTCCEQDLNLCRTWVQALLNEVVQ